RARADIARRGQTLGDGDDERPHPLLSHLTRCEATLLELSNRFGLDPKAEWLLARDRSEASRALVDLEAVRKAGAEARQRAAVSASASETTRRPADAMRSAETGTDGRMA